MAASGCPSCDPQGPSSLPVWLCLLPAPCTPSSIRGPQASSSTLGLITVKQLAQTVKGLGFGATVIRGCGPFVHGVNLGRWLPLPGLGFTCTMGILTGRQEAVTQVKLPSTAPGVSYQITAGVLEDCACPAQLGAPVFLGKSPSPLLSPPCVHGPHP